MKVQLLRQAYRFAKFHLKAKTRYNVHSPFVYDFTEAVLEDDRWFYAFTEIEFLRELLLADPTRVHLTDFGAGSLVSSQKERTIASIARYSANRPFACRILFRLVQHLKPKTLLELGTSLGISTLYQAAAAIGSRLVTIEGDPKLAHLAKENFKRLHAKNISLLEGKFEDRLPSVLQELGQLDYLFLDGNHRLEPVLRYFEACLAYARPHSVFVIDDIHWSAEMERAWEQIRNHPQVRLSLDLFFFGVVFFRNEHREKEHFRLIKWAWKPWAIGLGEFLGQ